MYRRLNFHALPALLWCALVGLCSAVAAQAQESVEYKIKAAYLLNFAKFVEWPTNRFPTRTTPIRVGVLGKDPFGKDLERTMAGRVIEGRKFEIVRAEEPEEALTCHIIFVSSSERRRLPEVLETLHKAQILTVGEHEQFVQQGGMIRFFLHQDTVRFEINAQPADKAGLRISSKLLQLAKHQDKP
jgi:hypothetical protein